MPPLYTRRGRAFPLVRECFDLNVFLLTQTREHTANTHPRLRFSQRPGCSPAMSDLPPTRSPDFRSVVLTNEQRSFAASFTDLHRGSRG